MAGWAGFEPATSPLSAVTNYHSAQETIIGSPGEIDLSKHHEFNHGGDSRLRWRIEARLSHPASFYTREPNFKCKAWDAKR
jgi:hypothetical protein